MPAVIKGLKDSEICYYHPCNGAYYAVFNDSNMVITALPILFWEQCRDGTIKGLIPYDYNGDGVRYLFSVNDLEEEFGLFTHYINETQIDDYYATDDNGKRIPFIYQWNF